jgi:putative phage-type endonuclease
MGLFRKSKATTASAPAAKTLAKAPVVIAPPTSFPYYELPHLEQGSDEWRRWRKGVIGASEAPTIMSENRWQSAQYLLEEKLGLKQEFTGNAATREGHRLEEEARRLLIRNFQVDLGPTVIQDGEVPYFAASLDAIDATHSQVFEIKCGAKAYETVASKREVPSYYYGQLQHILMITQLDKIVYAAYRPHSTLITLEIGRSESYISRLRETEEKFAEALRNRGHRMQGEFKGKPVVRS